MSKDAILSSRGHRRQGLALADSSLYDDDIICRRHFHKARTSRQLLSRAQPRLMYALTTCNICLAMPNIRRFIALMAAA